MMSLCFIVESGTDVRLVEGLANRFDLSIIARRIVGGVEISNPPAANVPIVVGPASRLKFALQVWRHLRANREKIDFVIVQGYGLAALAANVARRFTRTSTAMLVCSPAEAYYRCRRLDPGEGKPFLRRELWALRMAARLNALLGERYIVLSQYLSHVVNEHRTRAHVDVLPVYGVDTEIFTPPEEPKIEIKKRLGLPTTGTLIFFSSRIAPEKDSETLLKAIRVLVDSGRDLWLLHRSGGYKSFVQDAGRFGLQHRVIATDAVHPHNELPAQYRASDLCIQASREEGLGFSPLEALACQVPVIATAVGGLKETILDGQTGWTYPAGDERALASCIEAVIDNPTEASRRAKAGRRLVCAKYDSHLVFNQLVRLIWHGEELAIPSVQSTRAVDVDG